MPMNSIIAATDISGRPALLSRYRGKVAREIYRCGKGIAVTGSIGKPVAFAVANIPAEATKGVIYSAIGNVGEGVLGYISGLGFVRFLYKLGGPRKLKATARVIYNIVALPMTVYAQGIGATFDLLQVSKLETMWFGSPVYIFDDNRIWIEKNFTIQNAFENIEENM